jgi:uncharacterized membrane protein
MADEQKDPPKRSAAGDGTGRIKEIGGLIAVLAGLLAMFGVAVGAFIVDSQTAATVAGSAAAAIGSMVGAYFGVKVGTDQTKSTAKAQQKEAAKAQVYAAHVPEHKADHVVRQVLEVAKAYGD